VRRLKNQFPDLLVITDLCFCEYTTHGHCGVLERGSNVTVDNDATLKLIAKAAVAQARAGADIIAPSGMMDGMVRTIRVALDRAGFQDRLIMSYAAKFASAFYGPFREAAGSTPQFGDRRGYQMNPANVREALREVALDVQEGADLIMVKPALAYLDIIRRVREEIRTPVVAYNVSGEYSMVKAAAEKGWVDGPKVAQEILLGIRRAGADWIISYHTEEFLEKL
jgi:porphobilinogen synthase